jgi:hypothetical protein
MLRDPNFAKFDEGKNSEDSDDSEGVDVTVSTV